MLIFGGLREKCALKRAICVPVQNLHYNREEPYKSLIDFRGRRSFRMRTDFQLAVRYPRTRILKLVPVHATRLLLKATCLYLTRLVWWSVLASKRNLGGMNEGSLQCAIVNIITMEFYFVPCCHFLHHGYFGVLILLWVSVRIL
jgi:hypothetical protein